MTQVHLDGELPRPAYIEVQSECVVPQPSLAWSTLVPMIVFENLSGRESQEQAAVVRLTGGVTVTGTASIRVGSWVDEVTYQVESSMDTGSFTWGVGMPPNSVTNVSQFSGALGTVTRSQAGVGNGQLGPSILPLLAANGTTRKPICYLGVGVSNGLSYGVGVDLYSNNLMGIASAGNGASPAYAAATTPLGAISLSGAYPAVGTTR
ncbi:hypothetical protein LLE81_11740, partial [Staphylococcus epidermidis]|nr:hypothetical protein [Staphylococcus epidermidis]